MNDYPAKYDDSLIDIKQILNVAWLKRWWIIASIVFCTVVFGVAAFVIDPVYNADTILIPANISRSSGALSSSLGQLGGLASLAGLTGSSNDSETTEALAILRSREFIQQFIEDQKLMQLLFEHKWDAANAKWRGGEKNVPTVARAYKYFLKNVMSVSQDKKTLLITLRIELKDRMKAALLANDLVRRINEEMRSRAISNSDASIGYLEKELRSTSVVATQDAINRLIEAQVKQRMLANVTPDYAFRVIDKALPPDVDDPIRPSKVALLLSGPIVGCVLGLFIVFMMHWMMLRVEQQEVNEA